jgi:hypothetical protein
MYRARDQDEQAYEERQSPSPGRERRVGGEGAGEEEDGVGAHDADGDAELDDAAVDAPLALGGVLGGQQHRAAPLGAHREALDDAEGDQQDRSGDADRVVCRKEADAGRGHAHQGEREDQHRLAAALVAELAGDDAAEGAGEEADGEGGEGGEHSGRGAPGREVQVAEHQGGGDAEDQVVLPHDGRGERPPLGDAAAVDRGEDGRGDGGGGGGHVHACTLRWVRRWGRWRRTY